MVEERETEALYPWGPQHSFLAAAPEIEPTLQKADMTHVGQTAEPSGTKQHNIVASPGVTGKVVEAAGLK